jgi:SpoVK/Ycf46/Vps4 family AAA+-type ATPase
MDILQPGLGETEDILTSLFETNHNYVGGNVLILLDDIEYIIGTSASRNNLESHFIGRCRSTYFALYDALHRSYGDYDVPNCTTPKHILFISTTSFQDVATCLASRLDHVYHLEPPNPMERQQLIQSCFLHTCEEHVDREGDPMVHDLVESTVGKSYAEIVQLCRQSIEYVATTNTSNNHLVDPDTDEWQAFNIQALVAMKDRLQAITPESLRGEYLDGYVDMRVLSSRDLLLSVPDKWNVLYDDQSKTGTPINSTSPSYAWNILQSSIVLPLCRSKELYQLMDKWNECSPRIIVGAVLLTGESGSGKSEMAMQCARYAATLLPSVTLIDVSCTSIIHKEVGASEQAIRHLFEATRRAAPAILLMDGIETIAAVRGNDSTTEGTMDRILSTLLIELDGIDDGSKSSSTSKQRGGGIAVIGITHDADWIDSALKRPGRFDRVVHLSRE